MTTSTNSTSSATRFRITGEDADTGEIRALATSADLNKLAQRLDKDGKFWASRGWECLTLEDDSLGHWTDTLAEDLKGRMRRGEVAWENWKTLRHHAL